MLYALAGTYSGTTNSVRRGEKRLLERVWRCAACALDTALRVRNGAAIANPARSHYTTHESNCTGWSSTLHLRRPHHHVAPLVGRHRD